MHVWDLPRGLRSIKRVPRPALLTRSYARGHLAREAARGPLPRRARETPNSGGRARVQIFMSNLCISREAAKSQSFLSLPVNVYGSRGTRMHARTAEAGTPCPLDWVPGIALLRGAPGKARGLEAACGALQPLHGGAAACSVSAGYRIECAGGVLDTESCVVKSASGALKTLLVVHILL